MVKVHGPKRAKLLKRRLAQLAAAPSLADLAPPYSGPARCHELTGSLKGQFSVDLDHPYRLLFKVKDEPPPKMDDGGWDWNRITEIEILSITDTHG